MKRTITFTGPIQMVTTTKGELIITCDYHQVHGINEAIDLNKVVTFLEGVANKKFTGCASAFVGGNLAQLVNDLRDLTRCSINEACWVIGHPATVVKYIELEQHWPEFKEENGHTVCMLK